MLIWIILKAPSYIYGASKAGGFPLIMIEFALILAFIGAAVHYLPWSHWLYEFQITVGPKP